MALLGAAGCLFGALGRYWAPLGRSFWRSWARLGGPERSWALLVSGGVVVGSASEATPDQELHY